VIVSPDVFFATTGVRALERQPARVQAGEPGSVRSGLTRCGVVSAWVGRRRIVRPFRNRHAPSAALRAATTGLLRSLGCWAAVSRVLTAPVELKGGPAPRDAHVFFCTPVLSRKAGFEVTLTVDSGAGVGLSLYGGTPGRQEKQRATDAGLHELSESRPGAHGRTLPDGMSHHNAGQLVSVLVA
jgi:hypothetical protein